MIIVLLYASYLRRRLTHLNQYIISTLHFYEYFAVKWHQVCPTSKFIRMSIYRYIAKFTMRLRYINLILF